MANQEHLDILKQGVNAWNTWREEHLEEHPDLQGADLQNANLQNTNLREANLENADLTQANLHEADCRKANLGKANLLDSLPDTFQAAFARGAASSVCGSAFHSM